MKDTLVTCLMFSGEIIMLSKTPEGRQKQVTPSIPEISATKTICAVFLGRVLASDKQTLVINHVKFINLA